MKIFFDIYILIIYIDIGLDIREKKIKLCLCQQKYAKEISSKTFVWKKY